MFSFEKLYTMITPPVTPERFGNKSAASINASSRPLIRKSLGPNGVKAAVIVSALGVSFWAYITFQYSQDTHNKFHLYQHRLQGGWLFGKRSMDNSDSQYAGFRNNIPILFAVMLVHLTLSIIVCRLETRRAGYAALSNSSPRSSLVKRIFSLVFSVIFLSTLYGASIIKILAISLIPYTVTEFWKGSIASPIFCWIYSILILFLNQAYQGYKFAYIHDGLQFLDAFQGVGIRWFITFNFTILRIISYSMDQYWAHQGSDSSTMFESHTFDCRDCDNSNQKLCEKSRIQKSRSLQEYNLFNYMTYLMYAPLYMSGPIISFNNFISQMSRSPKSITRRSNIQYAARWIGAFLLMEVMMHLFYVVAFKDTKEWAGFSSLQIFTLGYFNLNFIWLKLLIIWRFFRMWALIDGIDTQENMLTCMSNNYSGIEFWRGWHASYNKWLIRYLYIPFGGSRRRILNSFLTFTFVAMWHDIELKLLAWGWLIVLFILPELVALQYFCTPAMRKLFGDWHLQICAFGGLLSIWMMMAANLVGFAVGLDGMMEMLARLLKLNDFLEMISVSVVLFCFVHIQFYVRARDASKRRNS